MTDEELQKYSEEHVDYEIWMLNGTRRQLSTDPAVHRDPVVKNALIESFCIHARALTNFLYPEEAREQPSDVTSDKYVKDAVAWKKARGPIAPELKEVTRRTGKEIAHLTTARKAFGESGKEWNPELIASTLCTPLETFVSHVPAERLYAPVAQSIAGLAAAAAPVPAPAAALSSGSPIAASTSVPTGRIGNGTDVSTP